MQSRGIHQIAISWEMLKMSTLDISLKITILDLWDPFY